MSFQTQQKFATIKDQDPDLMPQVKHLTTQE